MEENIISVNLRLSASHRTCDHRRWVQVSAFNFRLGLALAVLTGACLLLTVCVAVPAAPIAYAVTPGRDDVQVTYQVSGGDVAVEVHSRSGIGSAQLTQTGGARPPR